MSQHSFRRFALCLVALGSAAGGTVTWLGSNAASGSTSPASTGSLTFAVPTISLDCENLKPVAIELFVESPTSGLTAESVFNGTCTGGVEEVDGPPPLVVANAPKGTYEIGVQASSPGSTTHDETFAPVVTNSKGTSIAAGSVTLSQTDAAQTQNVVPFVYDPKLFKLAAGS